MEVIYVLQLICGKYYVGKTCNLVKRMDSHYSGNGSLWTRKYKVMNIYSKRDVEIKYSSSEETKETCKMMLKYGPNNVRGAEYISINFYTNREIDTFITNTIGHHLNMNFEEVRRELSKFNKPIITVKKIENLRNIRKMEITEKTEKTDMIECYTFTKSEDNSSSESASSVTYHISKKEKFTKE